MMEKMFYNRFDSPYKILQYIDSTHVVVEFQDKYKSKVKTVIQAAKNGNVKNPYDKSVFGIACLGEGKYQPSIKNTNTQAYNAWNNMLARCYVDKYSDDYKAYCGICTVCEEWLNFQNFAEWYENNKYDCDGRLHVDKDILVTGNKVYSPETCLLVPQRINLIFMTYPRKHDADLPTGISRSIYKDGTCKYKASYNTKWLGAHQSLEDCMKIYDDAKKKHVHEVAEEYKAVLPEKVYMTLSKWKVENT